MHGRIETATRAGVQGRVTVSAEFVAATAGIGYLIRTSRETHVIENMFAGIIVITVLGR